MTLKDEINKIGKKYGVVGVGFVWDIMHIFNPSDWIYDRFKKEDVVELTTCDNPSLLKIRFISNHTAICDVIFTEGDERYVSEPDLDSLRILKRASIETNQLQLSFMKDEDTKLDNYLHQRLQKEEEKWKFHHKVPGIRQPTMTSVQIGQLTAKMLKDGKSVEEIKEITDKLIGG